MDSNVNNLDTNINIDPNVYELIEEDVLSIHLKNKNDKGKFVIKNEDNTKNIISNINLEDIMKDLTKFLNGNNDSINTINIQNTCNIGQSLYFFENANDLSTMNNMNSKEINKIMYLGKSNKQYQISYNQSDIKNINHVDNSKKIKEGRLDSIYSHYDHKSNRIQGNIENNIEEQQQYQQQQQYLKPKMVTNKKISSGTNRSKKVNTKNKSMVDDDNNNESSSLSEFIVKSGLKQILERENNDKKDIKPATNKVSYKADLILQKIKRDTSRDKN